MEQSPEPAHVDLEIAAEVVEIIRLTNRAQMEALDPQHIWTPPLIDMRFNYRPQNPLYLLIVRAFIYGLMALHLLPLDSDGAYLYGALAAVYLCDWWYARK